MKFAWAVVLSLFIAGAAWADDDEKKATPSTPAPIDQSDRINKLEIELQKLKAENAARQLGLPTELSLEEQDKTAKAGESVFSVTFTDGFHLKTADGNFDLHIGGRWEEEYRYTFGRGNVAGRTAVNTFYAREAFLTMDGTLFHDFGFKVNGDFSQAQTAFTPNVPNPLPAAGVPPAAISTGAIVEEFWVEWKEFKEFRIMFGSFKAPISFEVTDSPRFAEMIQRSPMARFMPNFDYGIQVYGNVADSIFTYQLAIMNGRSNLANTGRGNLDDNDGKEYDARLTLAPFAADKDSLFKFLRVGGYGSIAHEGQSGNGAVGLPGNINTNELNVNYFQFANAATYVFRGSRARMGMEFTYAVGPAMVRGEYMERIDNVFLTAGATNHPLRTSGYYVEATFVVTGEDRIPNARIVPKHNLSLTDGGFGALELAARYGGVNMDNGVLTTLGATSAGNANGARDLSFGVNWWLCQNVKICVDYVRESYDGLIALPVAGNAANRNHADGFLMRFQVDF